MEVPKELADATAKLWTPFRVKNDPSLVSLNDESEH
jgi:hypothetical protein